MHKSIFLFIFVVFAGNSYSTDKESYTLETFFSGLDEGWGIVELPSGDFLVTELAGKIRIIKKDGSDGGIVDIPEVYSGGRTNSAVGGQGGLSDLALHPDYESNGWVYFSYSDYVDDSKTQTSLFVDRAKIINNRLEERESIFIADAKRRAPVHFGAKLMFLEDNSLLITSGDGFDYRELAQTLDNHFGKIVRVNDDGSIPINNPFFYEKGALKDIWAYGIRNPQGIATGPNNIIFYHEHGPRGGDELNILEKGKNYGWPAITYGVDYVGSLISPFTEKPGMEQPIYYWTPSIAPSSMIYYSGNKFKHWKDKIFITGLVPGDVRLITLDGKKVTNEEILFKEIRKRIRNIIQLKDGNLMIVTDKRNGKLIKVLPLKS
tara:strand:- start:1119 stop:2249 length:1131 start_codon:yes stop_codon:yes gene_type:complete